MKRCVGIILAAALILSGCQLNRKFQCQDELETVIYSFPENQRREFYFASCVPLSENSTLFSDLTCSGIVERILETEEGQCVHIRLGDGTGALVSWNHIDILPELQSQVRIYGRFLGNASYRECTGEQVTIPYIQAEYYELLKDSAETKKSSAISDGGKRG